MRFIMVCLSQNMGVASQRLARMPLVLLACAKHEVREGLGFRAAGRHACKTCIKGEKLFLANETLLEHKAQTCCARCNYADNKALLHHGICACPCHQVLSSVRFDRHCP